ncbi:ATP synthase [Salipiger aestuarii]|uniref:Flagellum-specific ATP synthase n=1 Tax=Salipiger aestuarii TaxID=568098 RepID=A0A327XPM7_9RHOB|nr:FliI/YscN family ATPase [Salipiger aestuarii]EIE52428.1 ATP synthase FliI/YscN [Citreicella sp. 357]KAA8604347.1 ATP synthase [Salipiger aestuarii]KAB2532281.1 ATP synthase [Salipiger aestuarii]RAK09896.1 flagellum-specific ATP synthase [Salipiger aestuarii]
MDETEISGLRSRIAQIQPIRAVGRVRSVDGTVIWVRGLAHTACIGDRLRLYRGTDTLDGEVLRIREDLVAMLPDEGADGVSQGDRVAVLGPPTLAPSDGWIGRVIDPYGMPLDEMPLSPGPMRRPFRASPPPAAQRRGLGARLPTGLASFDTLLPIARGQRMGLFAGSGVGKSRLLSALARGMTADVVVLALVGERGREVHDFVHSVLGQEGMARSVVVAATSDRSPLERRRCPLAAMTIAEHFRDQGMHVLYLADSITRFAEAHREVAVAAGEMPALRGFPPSTAHQIMRLAERAGPGLPGAGDITAVFSVLVAGSDMDEPVADILRGVLDGHVVLSRDIAERGRFPAIDILRSVSRSLPEAANAEENSVILQARQLLGAYSRSETMIRAGLYREGEDPVLDQAIRAWPDLDGFIGESSPHGANAAFNRLRLILRRSGAKMPPAQRNKMTGSR